MADPTVTINVFAQTSQANSAMAQTSQNIRVIGNTSTEAGGKFGGMISSLASVGKAVVGLAAAYVSLRGAISAMRSLISVNMSFEDSMASAKAVTEQNTGFTMEAFQGMQAEARRLGATTRFSASQAAEGLKFLGMAGFTAEQATASLAATLDLATAGSLDLGRSADIVSNIMSAFKADASDTGAYVDVLAKAAGTSNNSVSELGDAFTYAASTLSGFKQSVGDSAAAFAVLGDSGIKAGTAGAGLRMVLAQLSKQNGPTVAALKKLGVSFEEINPAANSLVDIFSNLRKKNIDITAVFTAFDARAANVAQTLIQNSDALGQYSKSMADSKGAAGAMASTMDDTFGGSVLRVKSAWQELMLVLGDSGIMSGLRSMLDSVTGVIGQMQFAVKVLTKAFQSGDLGTMFFLSLRVGAMKGVNFLLGAMLTAFKIAVAYLTGAFSLLSSTEYWENLFNIFTGVGKILLGIGAQFGAEILGSIQPFVTLLWTGVSYVLDKLQSGFEIAGATIVDILLFGVEKVLAALDSIAGVDFSDELEGVKELREANQSVRNDAMETFGRSFDSYGDEAAKEVANFIDELAKGGAEMTVQGLEQFGSAASENGAMLKDKLIDPMVDAASEFKPLDVFGGLDDTAQGELDKLWMDNVSRVSEDAKKKKEVGAPKGGGVEDEPTGPASGGGNSGIVVSSLQAIGGGGGIAGVTSLENSSARTASATEQVALNTSTLITQGSTTSTAGSGVTSEIGTGAQSSQQLGLLQSILDVLRDIRDAYGSTGVQEIQVT
jgi:TP901 family phage tail tape measure protein